MADNKVVVEKKKVKLVRTGKEDKVLRRIPVNAQLSKRKSPLHGVIPSINKRIKRTS